MFGFFAQRFLCRPIGALRSPWPWKVWPSGPARSVLRSPGRKAPLPCRGVGQRPTPLQSTNSLIIQSIINPIPFVSFVSFVISKHTGSQRALARRPSL